MTRCKVRFGYGFRTESGTSNEKPGIYFGSVFETNSKSKKISDDDILRIYNFLGKYINKNINKRPNVLYVDVRASANRILRAINTLEGKEL